jgi:5-formyltetrahydrofolate cyclo-ligase
VAHVLQACPPPADAVVAGVWPFEDEFDLRPLMQALHARGHPIVLPVTPPKGQPLTFARSRPGDALVSERFGTLASAGAPAGAPAGASAGASAGPPDGEEMVPDFLLVPLLAFDRQLHRLGYGAGYYDRTLAALRAMPPARSPAMSPGVSGAKPAGRFALGYGFAAQQVDVVPAGRNDTELDAVATEHGIIRRGKS